MVILPLRLIQAVLKSKQYCFDGNSLHCFVRGDGELHRERLCQSRATAFSRNGRTHGSEELSTFITSLSSSTQSVVSGRNLL